MAQAFSGKTSMKLEKVLPIVDAVTKVTILIGGIVTAVTALYLLWNIFQGNISEIINMPQKQADQSVLYILWSCKLLILGGMMLIISVAARSRDDSYLGYAMLGLGVLLCWGFPVLVNSSLQTASSNDNWVQGALVFMIVNAFKTIGITSMIASVPYILVDLWSSIQGVRRECPKPTGIAKDPENTETTFIRYYCWQMPYCRVHLRSHCKAYAAHKACWRIKNGCYCDEEMLLKAMTKNPSMGAQLQKQASFQKSGEMNAAQKRARCRQCFIYSEHQKQKYRMISPFVFPAVGLFIWMFYEPLFGLLTNLMAKADQFAKAASFLPANQSSLGSGALGSSSSTETAAWILIACIGLAVASYVLRGLEYLVFELQV